MAMISITSQEAIAITEALETAIFELKAAQEEGEWVETTGVFELLGQAYEILGSAMQYEEKLDE